MGQVRAVGGAEQDEPMADAATGDGRCRPGASPPGWPGCGGPWAAAAGSEVPCDGCTACCTSSQFVHIGPDETDTLARIPRRLLFPAPRLPAGHVLMGYDENGHCPMLVDGACSIYEHRPRTCRTYDCRVFPAAGHRRRRRQAGHRRPGPAVALRPPGPRSTGSSTRRCGRRRPTSPSGRISRRPATQRAVLAVRLSDVFLDPDDDPEARPALLAATTAGPQPSLTTSNR